ncbi:MAG TPA: cysteine--tRNA ligase [Ignavibacteriaceae bacterium]|nr:cysteine--tRNA ligase [Ignavibacteriaceae bacterium]
MLTLYNTLTKKKEEFKPLNPPNVNFYICGPTVYDYFHIGNARSFIISDMLRRYLIYKGYKVKFVMNITDIDDRIIKKSIDEKISFGEVSGKYTRAFLEDIKALKLKPADVNPKATEHIGEIINLIKTLEEKRIAYNVDGDVFYDVSKFKEYGKLSGKNLEQLESGARVEINETKKNPLDFALWKKAKPGEPSWESPWGEGRPGWHIECSAMSCKHLGESFDIHAGGNDLIFPHHENEIAQSEGATGKPFVKYWLHFGFLNINEEKMSKSLGNFFTARDILKNYSAEAIRLFFAQAYYRGPLNFSDELLQAAQKGVEKFVNLAQKINDELKKDNSEGVYPEIGIKKYQDEFEAVMDDDFNSAQGVAVIYDFAKEVNRIIASDEKIKKDFFIDVKNFLTKTAVDVLGIMNFEPTEKGGGELEDALIEFLIELRNDAKKEKNFSLADKIRDRMKEIGVVLQDSKDGTTFKRV